MLFNHLLSASLFSAIATSSPLDNAPQRRQAGLGDPYAPNQLGTCPSSALVRAANGVNPTEAAWVAARKTKATASLKTWLAKSGLTFPALSAAQYPTLGLVDGGGGLRGFLMSAGVHKAFDSAEGNAYTTSGLYQAMTYETGLSGSAVSLGSYVFNNWPTTTSLLSDVWVNAFNNSITMPGDTQLAILTADVASKLAAGYDIGLVDVWGRLLSYAGLLQTDAGVAQKYSDVPALSKYAAHTVPLPIMTSIGINVPADGCGLPAFDSPQYEFTPYEFGSWEKGIANFMQTKYIGTTMLDGSSSNITCTTGFDNAGWIMGTSTDTFNQQCAPLRNEINSIFSEALFDTVKGILDNIAGVTATPLYSLMPNPFFGISSASTVSNDVELTLVDGGESIQVPPIWPLLYRDVDVIFVSDNSADHPTNYSPRDEYVNLPSGQQIHHTYQQAQNNGVADRLPVIPNPTRFQNLGLNKKTVFFGCNLPDTSDAMRIVYLPNRIIEFNSSQFANRLQYDPSDTAGMIANGVAVGTNNGGAGFGKCVACLVMKKAVSKAGKSLPAACAQCFTDFCYN